MKPDLRMGRGHWRGCHSFKDIICDGDTFHPADGRDGGLKMGGLYWYFYQLNGYIDYHNSAEPYTTSCPFLPGQVLNVLEVPTQTDTRGRCGSTSSLVSTRFTLNPEDKYLKPRPPNRDNPCKDTVFTPLEEVLALKDDREGQEPVIFDILDADRLVKSLNALVPCCGYEIAPQTSLGTQTRSEPISREGQTLQDLSELRHTRSDSKASYGHNNNGRPFTRNGFRAESFNMFVPMVSVTDFSQPQTLSTTDLNSCHDIRLTNEGCTDILEPHNYLSDDLLQFEDLLPSNGKLDPLPMILAGRDDTHPIKFQDPNAYGQWRPTEEEPIASIKVHGTNFELPSHVREPHTGSGEVTPMHIDNDSIDDTRWHNSSSVYSSVRSSQMISPSLTCSTAWTGYMSPVHLGQPSTPQIKDLEEPNFESIEPSGSSQPSWLSHEDHELRSGTESPGACGFSGYSLPEAEYTSALTLCNLTPATLQSSNANSPFRQGIGHEHVESWNDGALFEDVLHDLSYLGGVIV